jgi:hypothetical protein
MLPGEQPIEMDRKADAAFLQLLLDRADVREMIAPG